MNRVEKRFVDEHRDTLEEFVRRGHTAITAVNKLLEEGMNLESKLKADLVTECKKLGAYARRHEDRYALGLLDLSIKFPDRPHLLVEAKIIEWQKFQPTPRQWKEGNDYTKAGGLCCLIGWTKSDKRMFVHRWAKEVTKADCFAQDIGNYAETLLDYLKWEKEDWLQQAIK